MPKQIRQVAVGYLLVLSVAACGGLPLPIGTTSQPPPSPSASPVFALTSPAFADGAEIPQQYGCRGTDVSPELDWSGAPAGTQELVLIAVDADANGFLHWLLT